MDSYCAHRQEFCVLNNYKNFEINFHIQFILYLQIINKRCRDIQSYFYHFHPSQQHPRAERGAKEVGVRHYRVRVVGPEQDSED